jgi:PAS domain S-box-containing protein
VAIGALAILYFLAARLGLSLAFVNVSASPVWPPTGIALAAILLLGRRAWPGVFLGAYAANAVTTGWGPVSLAIAVGNTLEGVVGAYLVQRFAGGIDCFRNTRGFFLFAALGALAAPLLSATVGVASLVASGSAPLAAAPAVWLTWWLGDAVGAILIAPLFILWLAGPFDRLHRGKAAEAALLVAAALLVGAMAFTGLILPGDPRSLRDAQVLVVFLALPLIIWAGLRFRMQGASTVAALFSAIAVWGTLHQYGPFASDNPNESLLLLQFFMGAITLMAIGVASLLRERGQLVEDLRGLGASLEARVQQRTTELQQFRDILDESNDGFYIIDPPTGRFLDANRKGFSGLGRTMDELRGLRVMDVDTQVPDEAVWSGLVQEVERRGSLVVEGNFRRKDGSTFPIEVNARSLSREGRRLLIAVVRDTTERKRAQEEALKSRERERNVQELKEREMFRARFLNSAAHELATPLTPIKFQLASLKAGNLGALEVGQQDALELLDRNVNRLGNLVRDLLDASRLQDGQLRMAKAPVDLETVVRETERSFSGQAHHDGVTLEASADAGLWVVGDEGRLMQLLFNLVDNAFKFVPRGGRVAIRARREGGEALVRVEDTGPGMAAGQIALLFRPFSQVHDPNRHTVGGTGLGLYICKGIVEQHGGKIWCESPGSGGGSTFLVRLPLAPGVARPVTAG